MYSIEPEVQRGLAWSSDALLGGIGTIRSTGYCDLEIVGVWPLLKSSGTRNVGYFMTAGGK